MCDFTDFMQEQGAQDLLLRHECDFETDLKASGTHYLRVWHHDEMTVVYSSSRTPRLSDAESRVEYLHADRVIAEGPERKVRGIEERLKDFCKTRNIPVPAASPVPAN
jgi:hypothetical protein